MRLLDAAPKHHHPVRPELVEGPTPSVGFDRLNPNGFVWMGVDSKVKCSTYDASNNLGNVATANAWTSAWKLDTASNRLLSWQDPVQGVSRTVTILRHDD
jgi:hypothetical protein